MSRDSHSSSRELVGYQEPVARLVPKEDDPQVVLDRIHSEAVASQAAYEADTARRILNSCAEARAARERYNQSVKDYNAMLRRHAAEAEERERNRGPFERFLLWLGV